MTAGELRGAEVRLRWAVMVPEVGAQRVVQGRSGALPTQTPREAQCRPGLPLPAHGQAKAAEGPITTPCLGSESRTGP